MDEAASGNHDDADIDITSLALACEQAWNFDPRVRGIGVQL